MYFVYNSFSFVIELFLLLTLKGVQVPVRKHVYKCVCVRSRARLHVCVYVCVRMSVCVYACEFKLLWDGIYSATFFQNKVVLYTYKANYYREPFPSTLVLHF